MKTSSTRKQISSTLTACAFLAASLGACVAQEDPPELPPVGSMQANIEGPSSAPPIAKNAPLEGDGTYTNFANAWVRVKVLQAYATGIVLIPAIVMGAALTQEPTQHGGTWVWTVSAGGATADLEVRLGPVTGWDVDLYVTNAEVTRFLWVEGNFAADLSEGYWLGHDVTLPAADNDVLEIAWTYHSDTDRTLAFSNVNHTSPDVGDVVTFTVSGTTATLVYDDASDPDLIANISWDTTSYDGSIQVPGYNGGAIACWNTAFENASCE